MSDIYCLTGYVVGAFIFAIAIIIYTIATKYHTRRKISFADWMKRLLLSTLFWPFCLLIILMVLSLED